MISGLVLKYLNGECFVIRRGYETARPVSSSFCLTVPEPQFEHLIKQLQVILPQIDQVHLYDFAKYEVLLKMAGDFSPLVNHLQLAKQHVAVSTT